MGVISLSGGYAGKARQLHLQVLSLNIQKKKKKRMQSSNTIEYNEKNKIH